MVGKLLHANFLSILLLLRSSSVQCTSQESWTTWRDWLLKIFIRFIAAHYISALLKLYKVKIVCASFTSIHSLQVYEVFSHMALLARSSADCFGSSIANELLIIVRKQVFWANMALYNRVFWTLTFCAIFRWYLSIFCTVDMIGGSS